MDAQTISAAIASGHAYKKHVTEALDFPQVEDQEEFAKLIEGIISNPSEAKQLPRGRKAIWDEETKAVVIFDPESTDRGTAFVPKNGKAYFDELITA